MLVIFDLDGTLMDISKRLVFVRSKPKNWPAFERGIPDDEPKQDIINLYHVFAEHRGSTIILCSGRSEDTRQMTEEWLDKHGLSSHVELLMRKSKDYRADYIIKSEIFDQIEAKYGRIDMTIDDRNQVVEMTRERGITSLQCAPGDF